MEDDIKTKALKMDEVPKSFEGVYYKVMLKLESLAGTLHEMGTKVDGIDIGFKEFKKYTYDKVGALDERVEVIASGIEREESIIKDREERIRKEAQDKLDEADLKVKKLTKVKMVLGVVGAALGIVLTTIIIKYYLSQ